MLAKASRQRLFAATGRSFAGRRFQVSNDRRPHETSPRAEKGARLFSTAAVPDHDQSIGGENASAQPYKKLLEPLDLGPDLGILPNRVLMGSMHTGLEGHSMPGLLSRYLGEESHSLDRMAAYFKARAQGHVGLMVTGGIAPNWQGWTSPFSSTLSSDKEMEAHKVVTEAVHSVNVPVGYDATTSVPSRILLQILHTGRYAYHPLAVSASATQSPISPFRARELSTAGIRKTVRDFVATAVYSKEAGYDGVEVMGSEGYLLSQFLSPGTNLRTDEYGGSFANRSRIVLDIIRETRAAVGPKFIIVFRLSLLDLVEQGMTMEESHELAQQVEAAGCSIINTGIGWHEARVPTIATSVPRGAFGFPTQALKEANLVSIPIVATNRINNAQVANELLASGTSDLVSMARPLLADPDFVKKAYENRVEEINTCIACNQACLDHAFVGKTASCLVNPVAGNEELLKLDLLPTEPRLKIGVVGAGPAGMAFSLAAAQRGHEVTLYDRDTEIGGQFQMARRIPGKEEFHETVRYFRTMLTKYNVNVRLDTDVTTEDMQSSSIDKWIVATGVIPRNPQIPGQDHPNVLSYMDVIKKKVPVGKRVAVIGAGGIGFDVSEYLLHYNGRDMSADDVDKSEWWREWGVDATLRNRGGLTKPEHYEPDHREIVMLQRKKGKLGKNLGKTTGWIHRATLKNSGKVEFIDNVRYERIDEEGNLHLTVDGKAQVLEVDNIVICAGQLEYQPLQESAEGTGISKNVYTIGGAYAAGELDAKRAIDMGVRLAHAIHGDVQPGQHVFSAPVSAEERLNGLAKKMGLV